MQAFSEGDFRRVQEFKGLYRRLFSVSSDNDKVPPGISAEEYFTYLFTDEVYVDSNNDLDSVRLKTT